MIHLKKVVMSTLVDFRFFLRGCLPNRENFDLSIKRDVVIEVFLNPTEILKRKVNSRHELEGY